LVQSFAHSGEPNAKVLYGPAVAGADRLGKTRRHSSAVILDA
jgi:hypothetical protein